MDKITLKLLELEQERESIERCQKNLREQIEVVQGDELVEKVSIFNKNKEELKDTNRKIEVLNYALDIINDIG